MYTIASAAFFFLIFQTILFWTYFWQKNGYRLRDFFQSVIQLAGKKQAFIFPICLSVLIFLYGIVIFMDSFIFWYHLLVTSMFVLSAILFVQQVVHFSFKRPIFSVKSLGISLFTTFVISVLYMVPLVDNFLWLLFLIIFIPFFIACLVMLLAFPSEVYEDFVVEAVKKNMGKNKNLYLIGVTGTHSTIAQKYIYAFLRSTMYVATERKNGFLPVLKAIRTAYRQQATICLVYISQNIQEVKKLSQVLLLDALVCTSDVQDKQKSKAFLHIIKDDSQIVSDAKNIFLNAFFIAHNKKPLLYGLQNIPRKNAIAVFGYSENIRNNRISLRVQCGKDHIVIRGFTGVHDEIVWLLPAIFLARKQGVPVRKIEKIIRNL